MRCYYHNDTDGRCAAAIVRQCYESVEEGEKNIFIEVDYKDKIDISKIGIGENVVIVDFSFKPDLMNKLLKTTSNIIWIDHHKTAFEYEGSYVIPLAGLRDNKYSGCELAWQYFSHDDRVPPCVELIGDRDKWAWKFGNTAAFNQGLKLYPHHPSSSVWVYLLKETTEDDVMTKQIIQEGRICLKYRDNFCKDYADSYGFETEFEGHKAYALGIYMFGSEAFGERFKEYPLCLSFVYCGNKWTVGLYSETIDVSEIAKKYDGGGHTGAAGFVCNNLPFARLPARD